MRPEQRHNKKWLHEVNVLLSFYNFLFQQFAFSPHNQKYLALLSESMVLKPTASL